MGPQKHHVHVPSFGFWYPVSDQGVPIIEALKGLVYSIFSSLPLACPEPSKGRSGGYDEKSHGHEPKPRTKG